MGRLIRQAWILVLVTVAVWLVRLINLVGDDSLNTWAQFWRLLIIGCFFVFAMLNVAVLSGRWTSHRLGSTRLVAMFCIWTMVFWTVRSVGVLLGGYGTNFTLVHLALAVLSIGLSLPVYRLDHRLASSRKGHNPDRFLPPVDR